MERTSITAAPHAPRPPVRIVPYRRRRRGPWRRLRRTGPPLVRGLEQVSDVLLNIVAFLILIAMGLLVILCLLWGLGQVLSAL